MSHLLILECAAYRWNVISRSYKPEAYKSGLIRLRRIKIDNQNHFRVPDYPGVWSGTGIDGGCHKNGCCDFVFGAGAPTSEYNNALLSGVNPPTCCRRWSANQQKIIYETETPHPAQAGWGTRAPAEPISSGGAPAHLRNPSQAVGHPRTCGTHLKRWGTPAMFIVHMFKLPFTLPPLHRDCGADIPVCEHLNAGHECPVNCSPVAQFS